MAFPVDANRVAYSGSTAAVDHSVTLPTGIQSGDLLLMFLREAGSSTSFTVSGWTIILNQPSPDGSTDYVAVFARQADGTEGTTQTVTLSASEKIAAITYRITGAALLSAQAPEFSTTAFGASTAVDPTAVTPTGGAKDYLFMWFGSWQGEQTSPPATGPTNYTNWTGANSGTAGAVSNNCQVAVGTRQLNASSEDGPSVTISASNDWAAWTVAVHPAGAQTYTDSATVYFDLQASGTELAEYIDSSTVSADLQASGTEYITHEYIDADTAYALLQPSSAEVHEIPDAATVQFTLTPSSAETYLRGELSANFELGTSGNNIQTSDAGSLTPWDAVERGVGATITYSNAVARGALSAHFTTPATNQVARVAWSLGSALDHYGRLYVYPVANWLADQPLIIPTPTGNGIISIGANNIIALWNTGPTKLVSATNGCPQNDWTRIEWHFIHANSPNGSIEVRLFYGANADGITPDETLTMSGTDTRGGSDPAQLYLGQYNIQSNRDFYLEDIIANATTWPGPSITTDTGTVLVLLTPSSVEIAEYIDADTVSIDLQASGTDEYTPGAPTPTQTVTDRVAFTDLDTPEVRTDHKLYATCSIANGAHDGVLRFQLYDSTTAIGSVFETPALTATPTEYTFNIAEADAQTITNYANLEVSYYGYSASGDAVETRIHEIKLQVPAAAAAERLDSATIYLDLSVTSEEIEEVSDQDTVYADLTVESAEEHIIPDTAEVYFNLETTSVEWEETVDADSIYFDLQADATEVAEYADADTTYLVLFVTSVDTAEFIDQASVLIDLETSAIEAPEYAEASAVYLDIDASETDITEYVDTQTVYVDLDSSALEERVIVDAADVYFDLQASGTDSQIIGGTEYTEADTVYVDLSTAIAEEYTTFDADTVYADLQVTSAELAEVVEADSVYVDLQATGTELAEFVDTASVPLDLATTSVDVIEAADADTAYVDLQNSATDLAAYVEVATTYFDLQPSGLDEISGTFEDTATVPFDLQSSSVEIFEGTDATAAYFDLQASGTEYITHEYLDSATAYVDIQTSDSQAFAGIDADSAYFDLQVTSADTAQYVDASTTYVDLQSSGTEEQSRAGEDTGTAYLDVSATDTQLFEAIDTATIPFDLQTSSVDTAQYVDADAPYVDLQSLGTDEQGTAGADTDIAYLDLQLSSLDIEDYIEAAQAYLNLSALSQEFAEFVDAAEPVVVLTPSAAELRIISDADVAYIDLQPDTVDLATYIEVVTVPLYIAPSAAEVRETADLAEVHLDLQVIGEAVIKTILSGVLLGRKWTAVYGGNWKGRMINRWSL